MPESSKKFSAKFTKVGTQSKWIESLPLSILEIAQVCSCSERTVRDWRREKYMINYVCLEKLCANTNKPLPKVEKIDRRVQLSVAGKRGAEAVMKKFGRVPVNEEKRKERWNEWWEREGRHKTTITQQKQVSLPKKKTEELAEFVGIMMGDGGITNYQLTVTLHTIDDREYGDYISDLIQKLFSVPVSVRPRKNMQATDYVVSRKGLVDYCVTELGFQIGNKLSKPLTIPAWIKTNRQFMRACIRGLFDTDGSVYPHAYTVKGKKYVYKKICFTSASPQLVIEVAEFLNSEGIKTSCFARNVRIEKQASVKLFSQKIGFHNPKHLKRLEK